MVRGVVSHSQTSAGWGGAAQVMRPVQWVTLHNAFLKMWFDHA